MALENVCSNSRAQVAFICVALCKAPGAGAGCSDYSPLQSVEFENLITQLASAPARRVDTVLTSRGSLSALWTIHHLHAQHT